jgi:hypothetical protein
MRVYVRFALRINSEPTLHLGIAQYEKRREQPNRYARVLDLIGRPVLCRNGSFVRHTGRPESTSTRGIRGADVRPG